MLMLIFPALISISSCSDSDPDSADPVYKNSDFVGAWKCFDDSDIYYVLFKSNGTGKWVNEDLDTEEIISESLDWYYIDGSLSIRIQKTTQTFLATKLTESMMILRDEWGDTYTFKKIKASDIPTDSDNPDDPDDPNDPDDPDDPDNPDNPGNYVCQVKTVSAEPRAFSAVVTGICTGNKIPDFVGVQYSYYKNFPEDQSATRSVNGRLGEYTVEATGIVDLVKVYYRAYAVIGDQYVYGETKSFETPQGTYTIDGKTYKFIKVTGLASGSFSMMQTELPPNEEVFIDGTSVGCWNSVTPTYVTAGETREFLSSGVGPLLRFPSREEWMYAYSGGSLSKGYKYSGSNDIEEVAWYSANANGHARKPAQKKANELGFYDMSGNYAEICSTYDDDILESYREEGIKRFINTAVNMSAKNFSQLWHNSAAYGGYWSSSASDCQSFSTSDSFNAKGTAQFNGNIYSTRFVYSRPD